MTVGAADSGGGPSREARSPGDAAPFASEGPRSGALCLHGFSGTPFEVIPLARALAAAGHCVRAPLLAGHGNDVAALARTGHGDWLATAERALDELVGRTRRPATVVGFSTGGLLALRLAALRPRDVGRLVVIAPPLRLRRWQEVAIRALAALPGPLRVGPLGAFPKLGGFDCIDPEMAARNPALRAMPIRGLASLLDLAALVRRDLPVIRCPTLLVHARRDRTVPFAASEEVLAKLGAREVERLWLDRSGHLALIDVERDAVIAATLDFVTRHDRAADPVDPRAESVA